MLSDLVLTYKSSIMKASSGFRVAVLGGATLLFGFEGPGLTVKGVNPKPLNPKPYFGV